MPEIPDVPWLAAASKRKRHLVAVSGGADSVALLHLLADSGFRDLVVCHLDHGLRGRASTGDARFVEKLATSLGFPCESGKADVRVLAGELGVSGETAGRMARHAFFAACARDWRCPRILLAHHADDRAETVLWNLLRGSHGAKGMRENQSLTVGGRKLELIRPLLDVRRETLRSWLLAGKRRWREDATNAEDIATRNRLRNEAFPLLSDITGRDIAPALCRAAESGEDEEAIARWALETARVTDPAGRLHVPVLKTLPPALQRAALFHFLKEHEVPDLGREALERARALLDPANGPAITLAGGRRLRRKEGRIFLD